MKKETMKCRKEIRLYRWELEELQKQAEKMGPITKITPITANNAIRIFLIMFFSLKWPKPRQNKYLRIY
jgi:hypothetical protein